MNVLLQPVVSGCKSEKATVRRFSRGSDCIESLFRCLADRSRLAILQTLCKGAKTQPEMVAETGLSDPAVGIQLEYLLDCGLVKVRQAGQRVLYGLNVLRLLQLDEAVEETLIAALKYTSSNQRNSI
jgi:DNA-binding transcriptional ArsR family regulator